METNRRITTVEWSEEKAVLARETIRLTGLEHVIQLHHGDAREYIRACHDVSFCFLDAEKEMYADFYELIVPRLVSGGLLVADNALSHREDLAEMLNRAQNDERVFAMIVPIGKGELVCRKR